MGQIQQYLLISHAFDPAKGGIFERVPIKIENLVDTTSFLQYKSFSSSMPENTRHPEIKSVVNQLNQISKQNVNHHELLFNEMMSEMMQIANKVAITEEKLRNLSVKQIRRVEISDKIPYHLHAQRKQIHISEFPDSPTRGIGNILVMDETPVRESRWTNAQSNKSIEKPLIEL
ncbi:hypothetical protein HK096_001621 [Nowakowskiella sp. JEL0078]|nr:hypothetical protein HK096_001621 [Nowakowskiella sp. JEL0078]